MPGGISVLTEDKITNFSLNIGAINDDENFKIWGALTPHVIVLHFQPLHWVV